MFDKVKRVALQCNLEEDMWTKAGQINPRSRAEITACGMSVFHQIQRERQELMLMEEAAKPWLRPVTYQIENI